MDLDVLSKLPYNNFIRQYQQIIMTASAWLIVLFLVYATHAVTTLTGTNNLPSGVYSYTHTFPAGANSVIKAQFTITPFNSKQAYSALMVLDIVNNSYTSNFASYLHGSPINNPKFDLQNANIGKPQIIQRVGLSSGNIVYITVIVFDKSVPFSWTITINQMPSITSFCSVFGTALLLSQFCSNCIIGPTHYGAYCNIVGNTLSNNTQFNLMVNANSYSTVTIPSSSNQINLQYNSDHINLEVFVQFKYSSDEIAGFVNYVYNVGSVARYPIGVVNQAYQITISSGGTDVSVGIFNHNAASANVNIIYTTQGTGTNILVIVLGVLGGLLLIALIVAACFIIKRIRNPNQMVHPNSSAILQRQSQLQQNMLAAQQIQVYFPSVTCRLGFSQLQTSSMNLNKSNQQQNIDKDCVICLCPVEGNDLMKVTYCRHLFHAHCLTQWFKKQRNCPYCRQEYSKSSTIEHYQDLLKETKRNMLAGVELVQQILKAKMIKSSVLIEDVKD